jgi:hypothetical protein
MTLEYLDILEILGALIDAAKTAATADELCGSRYGADSQCSIANVCRVEPRSIRRESLSGCINLRFDH